MANRTLVVTLCGVALSIAGGLLSVATASGAPARAIGASAAPLPVPRPADLGKPPPVQQAPAPAAPAPAAPALAPSPGPAPQTGVPGAASSNCMSELRAMTAVAVPADVGPQPDPRCVIVDAVKVVSLVGGGGNAIGLVDKPLLACTTALVLAGYVHDLLDPVTKGTYGAGLATISTGPGLECRPRDHIVGAKLSAHGEGLAVDIASLVLADGRTFSVGHPKQDRDRSFERAARAGACGYFHTTLGPGADAFHEDHWHFDLLPRGAKGDSKLCE